MIEIVFVLGYRKVNKIDIFYIYNSFEVGLFRKKLVKCINIIEKFIKVCLMINKLLMDKVEFTRIFVYL